MKKENRYQSARVLFWKLPGNSKNDVMQKPNLSMLIGTGESILIVILNGGLKEGRRMMIERSKPIQKFLDDFARKQFGATTEEAQAKAVCLFCGKKITGFKDGISAREYEITGQCQECQDEMEEWGDEDDGEM